uniref:Uncharacterized protein n=1 Tax=Brassica campestris TaxID=3711 RepID=A0A3P6CP67_BRACM|nr:unnamed protein product [Brassica rapa]
MSMPSAHLCPKPAPSLKQFQTLTPLRINTKEASSTVSHQQQQQQRRKRI